VESGKLKVKSGVESRESGEWRNYVIEIKQAVVRCSLIASGNHVSPPAMVTDHASRAYKVIVAAMKSL
jgi:hypothetical protein